MPWFRCLFSLVFLMSPVFFAQTRLLRFPDIHGERVVFCHGGDLWAASVSGGTATRLTAHSGMELFPKFSPDGQWIAFTGQYDGDEQVYVIPSQGGEPRQLTYYPARGPLPQRWGFDNQVYGWTQDGSSVLFRSMREGWDLTDTRLYTVPKEGGWPVALPMPVSGGGDLAPDGARVVYSPLTRDFRTWKRYEGGWAQDLYIFDFAKRELTPVAHHPRTERDPMWIGDSICFASDRSGTLNLYRYDVATKAVTALTESTTWDVRWPSRGEGSEIVYEFGGGLSVLDTKTKAIKNLSIHVPDDGLHSRPSRQSAESAIEQFGLSPKGERAVAVARGEVFTAPIEKGVVRNLTNTPNAHERVVDWSPDGATLAFVSDADGEEDLWTVPQDASARPTKLVAGSGRRIRWMSYSPDGKKLSYSDVSGRLHIVDVASKSVTEAARDPNGRITDASWSPDSRWLAFSLNEINETRSIWIYGLEDQNLRRVTDQSFSEFEPYFDPDGQYLWFLSDRTFAPQLSTVEWNFATARTTGIFVLALRADVPHPFPAESDEVTVKTDGDKKEEKKPEDKKDEATPPKPVVIEFDGLAQRVARVPVDADHISNLMANKDALFFNRSGASYYGRDSERKTAVCAFDRKKREVQVIVEDASGYTLSPDGSKMLVREGEGAAVYDAKPDGKGSRKAITTSGLMVDRDPRQEWTAIFHETWRRFRDHFYAANMHGYDWEKLRTQYAELLAHVSHRADLNYVLGEMVAELNVSHAYVSGGDWARPPRAGVGLLGARLRWDAESKLYRIARILPGQNEEDRYRSPLTEIGVNVKEGDYLFAIDGSDPRSDQEPYALLRHKADRQVELLVGSSPDRSVARKVKVRPITSEADLSYLDFVLRNRKRVQELSGGRLGYIHIPDMGEDGIREFIKWYYGQIRKDGLVVDVRNNGGGNVSQMLIERLRRRLTGTEFSRNSEFTGTYPNNVFTGPMCCLLNENSASDGDIFPWMFRESKLGTLIGKRSWGGVVGITDHGPLLDGGTVNVPEFGYANAKGEWTVEGRGVDPDVVVENDPKSVLEGKDPQLERGVALLLEELKTRSASLPTRPADPKK